MKIFNEKDYYTFSNQAVGAVMMALQKSLMEQSDIVPVLKEFQLIFNEEGEVVVVNPPNFKLEEGDVDA